MEGVLCGQVVHVITGIISNIRLHHMSLFSLNIIMVLLTIAVVAVVIIMIMIMIIVIIITERLQ